MKRRFRLTRSTDIKRVRNQGKSFAHPLLVLVRSAGDQAGVRVGITTSRAVGNAVQRNHARRLLRESLRLLLPSLSPGGWDLVLIARNPMTTASFQDVFATVKRLLQRAGLLVSIDE